MKNKATIEQSETDWGRVNGLSDGEIDYSDCPPVTLEMFARAIVRKGLKPVQRKTQLTLRVDQDVVDWFKTQGRGWQTKMNALLRAYMEAHKA